MPVNCILFKGFYATYYGVIPINKRKDGAKMKGELVIHLDLILSNFFVKNMIWIWCVGHIK
jgi:hypothetical protein